MYLFHFDRRLFQKKTYCGTDPVAMFERKPKDHSRDVCSGALVPPQVWPFMNQPSHFEKSNEIF